METQLSLGSWLKRRRQMLGLTQAELAQRVSCSVITIRKLEADERRPSKLMAARLAECLGVPAADVPVFVAFARAESHLEAPPALPLALEPEPWRTSRGPASHLPVPLTPLLGREQDVAAARNLLLGTQTRLLTLLGPPGIGKTRLSLAVAQEVLAAFPDGLCFVELAPIHDPDLVALTIAQTLGVRESGGQPLLVRLIDHIADTTLLLVLDNFEQVLAAAPLVLQLLAASPGLKVLTTSRAPLNVRGEQQFPVPPLLVPNLASLPHVETVGRYPSVALFVERAQAVNPGFALTAANAPSVAAICAHLNGLPLAIELAAAWIRLLPPPDLLARLSSGLALLSDGASDLPVRHRTMRAAIDWSYNLLSRSEQTLLARLSVFGGGCTLAAVEAVCQSTGAPPANLLAGIASLLDKSLLRREEGRDDEPRFSMFETIREYAVERLVESGEEEQIRNAHLAFFLRLAEAAEGQLHSAGQSGWLRQLDAEYENLRGALAWCQRSLNVEDGLRLAHALGQFWQLRGYLSEGRRWLDGLMATPLKRSGKARARALTLAGRLAAAQADYLRAQPYLEESLAIWQDLADTPEPALIPPEVAARARRGMAEALNGLADIARKQRNYARARLLYEQSLTLYREMGDERGVAASLIELGFVAWYESDAVQAEMLWTESLALSRASGNRQGIARSLFSLAHAVEKRGNYGAAEALLEESLGLHRQSGNVRGLAESLNSLADVVRCQGDYGRAARLLEESLAHWQALGDRRSTAIVCHNLGHARCYQGHYARAARLFEESATRHRELDDLGSVAMAVAGLAGVASSVDQPERAARLFGAARALFESAGVFLDPADQKQYEDNLAATRAQLDEATFAAGECEGRAMTLDQVFGYLHATVSLVPPFERLRPGFGGTDL